MCLIVFAWKAHQEYDLIVAANRDEWHARQTAAAHWWPADLQAGGTWLGVTRNGRFAALTNFRDPSEKKPHAPSRGELVANFLQSDETPEKFLTSLATRANDYAGFNLLCADRDAIGYLTSPSARVQMLKPGVHVLSNGVLDEAWPKAMRAKSGLNALLGQKMPENARQMVSLVRLSEKEPAVRPELVEGHGRNLLDQQHEALFTLMSDTHIADDASLPQTGVGIEWERRLSAIKIVSPDYGTRCTTVLTRHVDGDVKFAERTLGANGDVTAEVHEMIFRI
jgi:uncharacterized protein with NRDE domain